MKLKTKDGLRTWIEVDQKSIAHNVKIFRSLLKKETMLMAVIKSNAYGHGLIDFAKETEKNRVDWIAVDSAVEGIALRKAGIKLPILILGHTLPERMVDAYEYNLSVTIPTLPELSALLKRKGRHPKFHLKIDTGMHRQGFLERDLPKVLSMLKGARVKSQVEGIYTHFASAKNPSFPQFTNLQMEEFKRWTDAIEELGFNPIKHASATAGAILFPDSHLDMVRIGIGLYGLWPSREVREYAKDKMALKASLSWKTLIAETKKVKKGERVGYDLTERLSRDSLIAIVPVGYWHGYPRALSSLGRVIVKGKLARVLGRVSMDMIVIDATGTNAGPGDVVTLLGKEGREEVSAEDIAMLADTVNYEIVTRLNPLIKRIYR